MSKALCIKIIKSRIIFFLRYDEKDHNHSILVFGDSGGAWSVYDGVY